MRVRLLIDTVIDDSSIPDLANQIALQPATTFNVPSLGLIGGRLVGAQPVHADESPGG